MTNGRGYLEHPEKTIKPWDTPGVEPKLEDMLSDPLIQLVMQRDGICRADVERAIDQTRARLMAAKTSSHQAAA